ncbi:MAG: cytochrome P450 [Chloroflexi bacterium]|nr:cytochrome P450 [Chloroflexota bacterium]
MLNKRRVRMNDGKPDRRIAAVPGPRGQFLLGSLLDVQRDPLTFLTRTRRLYGDVAQVKLGPKTIYIASHPEDVRHVLQENNKNYRKGAHYETLAPIFGNGLMLSEGDFWLRQRRLVQPAFHRQRLGAFGKTMTDYAETMLERWASSAERGQPLDIQHEMLKLTLSIVCTTLFSYDISNETAGIGEAHAIALAHAEHKIVSLFNLPDSWPTPENRRYQRAVATIHNCINRLMDERRDSGEDKGDLLSTLAFSRYEETGELMDRDQLRAEVITLFLNGHETVTGALSWAWYLLSLHPEIERKLHDELRTVLGGRTPTFADIPKLKYTTMVIEESMRLYPPAWVIERDALGEDRLGGYYIPPKASVVLSQWVTHRHPDFWENPEGFDPERFSPERSANRHRFAYFPFGGGPRLCVGANFAMMEMQLLLATIAQRYHLELVPGFPVVKEPVITLRPKYGVLMTLRPRADAVPAAVPEVPAGIRESLST